MELPTPFGRTGTAGFRAILAVARKELLASLRDRQTAIYTFVLPICMYPVLFWVMLQGFLLVQGQKERTEAEVGIAAARPDRIPDGLEVALAPLPPDANGAPAPNVVKLERFDGPTGADGARAWITDPPAGDEEAGAEEAGAEHPDAVLFLPTPTPDEVAAGAPSAQLFYDSTASRSVLARERVAERLPLFAEARRNEAARDRGHDARELDALEVRSNSIAPKSDSGALIMSFLLPMLLVVMAVMGAFFPAVDLTAGEKERGTAETTLLLPVPRSAIHQGKILAVCATAVVATFLNLLALGFSAENLLGMLARSTQLEVELPLLALVAVAPLALLFAFFVSAVLTSFAGLAASFKEGQALLGPVQMLFIFPATIGAFPGIELSLRWTFVPVVNVVLAFRAMLLGKPLYLEYALTALALLIYAWLAIALAVRMLSRESVAMSSATIPFKRLLATLRSDGGTR